MDRYLTINKESRVKIAVGACRFIASVGFCSSEEQARNFIHSVQGEFSDAAHNAYAYKIGSGDEAVIRTSDAAEPVGTAGPPLLSAIEKAGVTNVVLVGTRYFGGVKLGIGGLIRAYRACGQAGLEKAGIREKIGKKEYTLSIPYDFIGQVMKEISGFQGEVTEVRYGSRVEIDAVLLPGQLDVFQRKLNDVTRGQGMIKINNRNECK